MKITKPFGLRSTILTTAFLCSSFSSVFAAHNWTRTNPGGGGTLAMAGATANGNLLVASDLSGVYLSSDDGNHWKALGANSNLIATHTSALGFHTTNGNIFFVGTGNGLYKTSNGGVHFDRVLPNVQNPLPVEYIESIVVAKTNPNIVYVTQHKWDPVTPSSIYKSTDGGAHWQLVPGAGLPPNQHMVKLLVHPANANIVYALTGKSRWGCSAARLYQSNNGGANWTQLGANLGSILDMDVHPINTDIVFVSTFVANVCPTTLTEDYEYIGGNENSGEFYKITNGVNITQLSDKTGIISVGTSNPNIIRLVDILFPYDWNDNAGTWETINGGQTWTHTGLVSNWFTGYTDNQYYAYTPSFNGLSKTLTKDIFNSDRMYGVFGAGSSKTIDGGKHLNLSSTKKIATNQWLSTGVDNINGHALDISDSNRNVVYMGGYDIGFWHSNNHGLSWARTQPNYNQYSEYVWNIGDVPVDPQLAVKGEGANISTLLNDPAREGVVWVSFSKGQYSDETQNFISKTGLFKSTAYGDGLTLINTGLPTGNNSIRIYGLSLDINSPINNRTLYMTVKGDVYKSINDGVAWSKVLVNGGLKFTEVDKFNGDIVYAGGKNGLWRSTDAGANWNEVGIQEMRGNPAHSPARKDIVPTDSNIDWSTGSAVTTLYAWEGVFDIQTDPSVPNRLYVTVYGEGKGLYRSDFAGNTNTWTKLITDKFMRGVAIAPQNSNLIYATASESYFSGGSGNSLGIKYSTDAGSSWQDANDGMAWNYGGMIEVETGTNPKVWAWSAGTGVQHSLAELSPSVACNTAATVMNLPSNQWQQISLPCTLPSNAKTVQAVFGDDLSGTYGTHWVVFSYNPITNAYKDIGLKGNLAQGVGYWVIHLNGSTATLDLPVGSTQTTTTASAQCASSSKCYQISLASKSGLVQWNMAGHSFPNNVALNHYRVVTNSGLCVNGCTLDQAKNAGIVENRFWHYNGASYSIIQGNVPMNPWSGFWIAVLAGGDGLAPRLEIPIN
ncbi:MAG: hypothetical protein KAH20_08840 [Methylococcales bacterium]|nr:hypothetical protein [Methylococcales bacterium]